MDYFTKWPEAYALPDHEAEAVAEAFVNNFITRFGVPRELHLDQGWEFESVVFQECCQLLGIKKTHTTALRPQSDGLVERFHRMLIHQVAKYCSSDQRDWDVKLLSLLMAYLSAQHEATTHTPAKLMFDRELRLPIDLATGQTPQEITDPVTSNYALMLQERLITAY
ncbi:putative DNA replication complex GINS protein PSF2 [Penaeus vannamei]|uniref:Putative DNA replication complex GINS protein PSF2 n=1 Tax=Penaeus vannamei TaxID=6689 RepID=A0A3R7QZ34_PENVA|nr:putative DNA replication complex GINS protein PSF2 [Penaeus vannamei]